MYAIGEFVFGLNILGLRENGKLSPQILDDLNQLEEAELLQGAYSGSGDMPVYLGVVVDSIDEASDMNWTEITVLKNKLKAVMAPASNERKEFQKLLDDVLADPDTSDETKEWLKSQEPEVFLTWGTS